MSDCTVAKEHYNAAARVTLFRGWLRPSGRPARFVNAKTERVRALELFEWGEGAAALGLPLSTKCGWECAVPDGCPCSIQVQRDDDTWVDVTTWNMETEAPAAGVQETKQGDEWLTQVSAPTVLVVDNFYTHPDAVRAKASDTPQWAPECVRVRLQELLQKPISEWESSQNGVFHYSFATTPIEFRVHTPGTWMAIVFLTPEAPIEAGFRLARVKSPIDSLDRIRHDGTKFDTVDTFGNVYNRMVVFQAQHVHAASAYFGDTKDTCGVYQTFVFRA